MNIVKIILAFVFVVFFVFQVMTAMDRAKEIRTVTIQDNEVKASPQDIKAEEPSFTGNAAVAEPAVDAGSTVDAEPVDIIEPKIVADPLAAVEPAVENLQGSILEAVKAAIKDRSKATGSMDVYDSKTEKVRNLDLMKLQPTVGKDGDDQVVTGDFRDTKSGDVVTVELKVSDAGEIKDIAITNVQEPKAVKEEKKDYTDGEIQDFMKEYIAIQAQTTGTFDLYDEKLAKMRNLELIKLDEKVRRYGVIAISTAEFRDKNSGDTVMVDVNTENKGGLSVTAMRIKGITKAPVKAAE